jgi:molecular chaperone DnaK
VKVTSTSGLSQNEVDKLVNEGESFKEQDDLRRQLAELRNQAETLLYTTDQALEGYADLVEPDLLALTKSQAEALRALLAQGTDLAAIRDSYQKLESMTFSIAESMYGGAEGS